MKNSFDIICENQDEQKCMISTYQTSTQLTKLQHIGWLNYFCEPMTFLEQPQNLSMSDEINCLNDQIDLCSGFFMVNDEHLTTSNNQIIMNHERFHIKHTIKTKSIQKSKIPTKVIQQPNFKEELFYFHNQLYSDYSDVEFQNENYFDDFSNRFFFFENEFQTNSKPLAEGKQNPQIDHRANNQKQKVLRYVKTAVKHYKQSLFGRQRNCFFLQQLSRMIRILSVASKQIKMKPKQADLYTFLKQSLQNPRKSQSKYRNSQQNRNVDLVQKNSFQQPQLIINTILEELIIQLKDNNKSFKLQQVEKKLNDIISEERLKKFLIVWNFIMTWYGLINSKTFDLSYFAALIGIGNLENMSLRETKVKIFVKSYLDQLFLKRLLIQTQLIEYEKIVSLNSNSRNFVDTVYLYFFAEYRTEEPEVNEKIRYVIHFSQFFSENITDLSCAKNTALQSCFNCARFLLIFFLSHFIVQCIMRIFKEIQEKCGKQYYEVFKEKLESDRKWKQSKSRILQAIQLSEAKILNYIQQYKYPNVGGQKSSKEPIQIPTNSRKIKKIFEQNLKQQKLFDELRSIREPFYLSYDFPLIKNIYSRIIQLYMKECASQPVLERTFNKLLKPKDDNWNFTMQESMAMRAKMENFCKQANIDWKTLFTFNEEQYAAQQQKKEKSSKQQQANNSKNLANMKNSQTPTQNISADQLQTSVFSQAEYKYLLQEYAIMMFQSFKCFSMIIMSIYYSFATQRLNLLKKRAQTAEFEENQESKKQFEAINQLDNLFWNLDSIYIIQKYRLNSEYLQKHRDQVLHDIFKRNHKIIKFVLKFINEPRAFKEQMLKEGLDEVGPMFSKEYPIHNTRMCIFDEKQCREFFYPLLEFLKRDQSSVTDADAVLQQINARNNKIINGEREKQVDNDDIFQENVTKQYVNSIKSSSSEEKKSTRYSQGRTVGASQKSKKRQKSQKQTKATESSNNELKKLKIQVIPAKNYVETAKQFIQFLSQKIDNMTKSSFSESRSIVKLEEEKKIKLKKGWKKKNEVQEVGIITAQGSRIVQNIG